MTAAGAAAIREAGLRLARRGYAVHWLRPQSKAPLAEGWSMAPVATAAELARTYRAGYNVGVRCGHWSRPMVGHGLLIVDTDIRHAGGTTEALEALTVLCGDEPPPTVLSGSGVGSRHSWYACLLDRLPPKANVTILQSETLFTPPGKDRAEPLWKIEVLGTGKQVVCPPSLHPDTGQCYRWAVPLTPPLPLLPEAMHSAIASALAAKAKPYAPGPRQAGMSSDGTRPGDDFNRRADWRAILVPHGWHPVRQRGDMTDWRRPGKDAGLSATTNYAGSGLLYVFTTSAAPFEAETSYSPFAAYALLEHRGDFQAAAKALARQGYGEPRGRQDVAGDYVDPWLGPRSQWHGVPLAVRKVVR